MDGRLERCDREVRERGEKATGCDKQPYCHHKGVFCQEQCWPDLYGFMIVPRILGRSFVETSIQELLEGRLMFKSEVWSSQGRKQSLKIIHILYSNLIRTWVLCIIKINIQVYMLLHFQENTSLDLLKWTYLSLSINPQSISQAASL